MTVSPQRLAPESIRPDTQAADVAKMVGATVGSEPFDRITRLARRLLGVEAAVISLVDEVAERQYFLGHEGLPPHLAAEGGTHLDYSFCRYAVATGERLVVEDARTSALLSQSPAIVVGGVVTYAGAPLRLSPHEPALGTLCVVGGQPRVWTEIELSLLDELAELARTELDYRMRIRHAEEVENLALRLPDPIGRLSEAVRRVGSLVEDPHDPRLPRSADVACSRLQSVEVLTQDLIRVAQSHQQPAVPEPESVDLTARIRHAVAIARVASRAEDLLVEMPDEPLWVHAVPVDLDRAVVHALVAALHHAMGLEPAQVRVHADVDHAVLHVDAPGYAIPIPEALRLVDQFRAAERDQTAVEVTTRAAGTRVSSASTVLAIGHDHSSLRVRFARYPTPGSISVPAARDDPPALRTQPRHASDADLQR